MTRDDFQAEKAVVRRFHDELDTASAQTVGNVLARHVAPDWRWRGVHPFDELCGAAAVADRFWRPLMSSLARLQRRPDIFMAGLNETDGFESFWVAQTGHFMGLFDRPLLGIRPTARIVMLRFAEFNRVEDGRIAETLMFVDLLHLMMQAGQWPLPPQTGAHLVQPGPRTHDGLMYDPQDPARAQATQDAIHAMLKNPGRGFFVPDAAERLAEVWHQDMIWWGPAGIGAAYTIERYLRQHSDPFDKAFSKDCQSLGETCSIAEGHYGGFAGYPSMRMHNAGGYMGMTGAAQPADMRLVDIYRAQDGKLVENWVFIDILHHLAGQGLDVLGRMDAVHSGGG